MRILLVPSPFLGPLTWEPVAERLRSAGADVIVAPPVTLGAHPPYRSRFVDAAVHAARADTDEPPPAAGGAGGPAPSRGAAGGGVAGGPAPGGGAVGGPAHGGAGSAGDSAGGSARRGGVAGGPAPGGRAGVDVVVGYSGSGPLLPEIVARLGGVRRALFVDAALPHRPLSTARRAALRDLAVDGWLPPWSAWFPPEVVRQLVPDDRTRERFVAGLGRFPLAYFDEAPTDDAGSLPPWCGYLQLSAAYDDEAAEARRLGWLTRHEDLDHLAPLTRPATVVAAIRALLAG